MEQNNTIKRYTITWDETRKAEVFAKTEKEALLRASGMCGTWVKRDNYKVMGGE